MTTAATTNTNLTAIASTVIIKSIRKEFPTLMEKVVRAAVLEPTRNQHNPSPRPDEVSRSLVWIVPKRWRS
ncbi:hypothetical protein CUR85_19035 [Sulfitobacter faviae]|jgi:hypothetical protein|nr:hypothetical protein A3734_03375 [Sulfitobacter sp. HI0054]MDH4541749.1 hypothetical protein [Sulfitobacter faviae]MDH4541921.1 hypothetical protein [Sulfitobacter faviae]